MKKVILVIALLALTGCVNMKTPVALGSGSTVEMTYNYHVDELPRIDQKTTDLDAASECRRRGYQTADHITYGGDKVCLQDWAMGCSVFRVTLTYRCE